MYYIVLIVLLILHQCAIRVSSENQTETLPVVITFEVHLDGLILHWTTSSCSQSSKQTTTFCICNLHTSPVWLMDSLLYVKVLSSWVSYMFHSVITCQSVSLMSQSTNNAYHYLSIKFSQVNRDPIDIDGFISIRSPSFISRSRRVRCRWWSVEFVIYSSWSYRRLSL
jgi:hypothetical protein